ncbi:MAG: hypothetical protein WCO93_02985 [bacterium]
MKKIIKSLLLISLLTFATLISLPVLADPPGPPADHGQTGNQDPVGAPIDGGLGILVILAGSAGYGSYKLYKAKKAEKEKEENPEELMS